MPLAPGTLLNNRYRITSTLGQGGMGAVYRAVDENLDIPVAVKENLFLTDEYSRQFQREANILASSRHPNLPHVVDYFSLPGQGQYLIMEFIAGEDLRQRIVRLNTLPEEEVILIGASICDALAYLHARQPAIVHRDIKPGNIKITPHGEAILVDFGLAKIMHDNQSTTTGARAMTPGYSPPEQYGTARTDVRSDIYSLGATLYAALTGVIPEDGLSRATGDAELTPIRHLLPKVNRKLSSVIEKALEVDPNDRWQSALDFKEALLASGDMSHLLQHKPAIPPPPEAEAESAQTPDPIIPEPAPFQAYQRADINFSRHSKPRRNISAWIEYSALATVCVTLILLFIIRPDIPVSAVARFLPTQTPLPTYTPNPGQSAYPGGIVLPEINTQSSLTLPTVSPVPTETPTVVVVPSITPTPMGGGRSQIAFASSRNGNMQIWIMESDGSRQRQLTSEVDGACQPAWSPDGKQILFTSPCPGKQDQYEGAKIYIMDADGKNITPLSVPPSPEGDFDPTWSPNGKMIAFTSLRNGRPQIFTFNLDDQSLTELSKTPYADSQPSWSSTGLQIAFIRTIVNKQVWVMSDKGQFPAAFSMSGNVNNSWPAWTPDGRSILYSQMQAKPGIPWLVGLRYEDRGTSREMRIPPKGQTDTGPINKVSISPDGSWVVYESWPDGVNHDIYLMGINGANRVRLTTDPAFDIDAAWRPTLPIENY